MVAPYHATLEINAGRVRRVEAGPRDAAGSRAALRAVKPAVRSPHKAVRYGVRVLEAETRQPNFRRTIGNVVAISVWIKEQVRRVHHPHAAAPTHHSVGHVEPVEENFVSVINAIAISVFVDGND